MSVGSHGIPGEVSPVLAMRAACALCRATGVSYDAGDRIESATLDEVEEVLDLVLDAVRRARGIPSDPPDRRAIRVTRVARLAAAGWMDPEIARALEISERTVRRIRSAHQIPAGLPAGSGPPRSGWEERLRAAHSRGLTVREISLLFRWSRGTVCTRLSRLGLRAVRPSCSSLRLELLADSR